MADYISRQKAIEAIMDLPNCPNGYSDTYDKECIIGTLEEVPTADVVEVVRCKDCRYWKTVTEPIGIECEPGETAHYCAMDGMITRTFDFCSYGDRK